MKNQIIIIVLTLFVSATDAQQSNANTHAEKGISPSKVVNSQKSIVNNTYAVVVGISDYQDPAIPDLRFADRDAKAFADWLKSPNGGALKSTELKTLFNEESTTGKIIAALDWLISATKTGDKAIIYFSGHGDVERVTKFQRGYWLTWDSPPAVYAAGAFSLVFLQDVISTLADAGVQTLIVSDACRAGKLAGSEFGGAQATSAALAKQFANEIKILSCQPDEFSLEGEQWGGGRGAFSFHLIDALNGLADANGDGTVNLMEAGRYLEEKVPAETAPHSQIPMTVGSKLAQISTVNATVLAERKKMKTDEPVVFQKTDSRGLEDLALAKADSNLRKKYKDFIAAIDRGDLMTAADSSRNSANELYEMLKDEPTLADLKGVMTRNFAAALMDNGQQFINKLLKNDAKTIDKFWRGKINAGFIAQQLERAAELLGKKHYAYKTTKAKEYYFKSIDLSRTRTKETSNVEFKRLKQELVYKGLSFDPDAPYLIYSLAGYSPTDSIDYYIEKLTETAPNWVIWYRSMAVKAQYQKNDLDLSIRLYRKAIDIDSTFWSTLNWIAGPLDEKGEAETAKSYREQTVRTLYRNIRADTSRKIPDELTVLGNALWRLRRFEEAKWALNEANKVAGGYYYYSYVNLLPLLCDIGHFEAIDSIVSIQNTASQKLFQAVQGFVYLYVKKDFKKAEAALLACANEGDILYLVDLYIKLEQFDKAIAAIDSFPENPDNDFFLKSWIWFLEGKKEVNSHFCDSFLMNLKVKYIKNDFFNNGQYLQKALVQYWIGNHKEMNETLRNANQILTSDPWHHYRLACFYAQTGEPSKAFTQLDLAEKANWHPNPFIWLYGTVNDPFLNPLRKLPEFQAWEKRWSPPYKDNSIGSNSIK
ncbi:MAG: caspase family protein [Saprospiraceae bacterium]|nr:caspase family protein [Saprospiraceae bacterium]